MKNTFSSLKYIFFFGRERYDARMSKSLKKTTLPTLYLLLGATLLISAYAIVQFPKSHTLTENKEIEIRAFKTNNPFLCNTILGGSYYFGATDAEILTDQAEARQQCKDNIKNGDEPYLIGI